MASHVLDDLDGLIDLVLDAGPTTVGVESTVLDLTTDPPVVLRPGALALEELSEVLPVVRRRAVDAPQPSASMPSPGMLERHYSPRAPLTLYEGDDAAVAARLLMEAGRAATAGQTAGILCAREDREALSDAGPGIRVVEVGSIRDLPAVASRLYAALRELDRAGVDLIFARGFPSGDGLGAAIQDRLRRAAAARVTLVGSPSSDTPVSAVPVEREPTPPQTGP
jgi:L-threonylcarbamoyladenylate synthase